MYNLDTLAFKVVIKKINVFAYISNEIAVMKGWYKGYFLLI